MDMLRDKLIEAMFIARGAHEKVHLRRNDLAVLLDAYRCRLFGYNDHASNELSARERKE